MAIYIIIIIIVKYFVEGCRLDPYLQLDRKKLLKAAKKSAFLDFFEAYNDPLHHAPMTGDICGEEEVVSQDVGQTWE